MEGYSQLVLLKTDSVLSYMNFHEPVSSALFSREDRFLAVALGGKLKIFECSFHSKMATLHPYLNFASWHSGPITHLNFWKDFLVTSSSDQSVRFCALNKDKGYIPLTLTGHRKPVLGCFMTENNAFSVSEDARVFVWEWTEATPEFQERQAIDYKRRTGKRPSLSQNCSQLVLMHKHQLTHEGVFTLTAADMKGHLLVVGFRTGNFALYSVTAKEAEVLHTLSMSEYAVSAVTVNSTADWIAFASETLGQLLVWEWKSETYVLRQMGHSSQLLAATLSSDGQVIATGGTDGKLKLWTNGLCFCTFSDHSNGIVALQFTASNAVISASLDGSVRAYDVTRYKQFRVMQTGQAVEFQSLAVDGEIVCAGAADFSIYVWALPTGKVIEVLKGHTGPVCSLQFSPLGGILISGSWDGSFKVWDVFENKGGAETVDLGVEVVSLAIRPDGRQLCVVGIDCEIQMWGLPDCEVEGTLESRRDIAGGRGFADKFVAAKSPANKRINSIAYSPDGSLLAAVGESKYVLVYDLAHKVLLSRFSFTENRALSGVLDKLNSKVNYEEKFEEEPQFDEVPEAVRPGDIMRKAYKRVRISQVIFGVQFLGIVSTEGLMVFSNKQTERFLPMELTVDVSRGSVITNLIKEQYATALIHALKLGEEELSRQVLYRVPEDSIDNTAQQCAGRELLRLVDLIAKEALNSREIGLILVWANGLCKWHSEKLKGRVEVKTLLRNMKHAYSKISWMASQNDYLLRFLSK